MWSRPEASLNPSVGMSHWSWLDTLEGAPEAVRGGYKKRFRCFNTSPLATQSRVCVGGSATLTLRASFWKVLPPSSPGAQARPVSFGGGGELAIAFGVPKWGHTSYPPSRPPVVVWLLILASRTLARIILGTHVAGRHPPFPRPARLGGWQARPPSSSWAPSLTQY